MTSPKPHRLMIWWVFEVGNTIRIQRINIVVSNTDKTYIISITPNWFGLRTNIMIIFSCLTPFLLSLQDYPSDMMKVGEWGFGWQVWHGNGTACPHGAIPVRRVEAEAELSQGKYSPLISDTADRATRGHHASFFHFFRIVISLTYIRFGLSMHYVC